MPIVMEFLPDTTAGFSGGHRLVVDGQPGPAASYRSPSVWPDDESPRYIGLTAFYGVNERVFEVSAVEFSAVDNSGIVADTVADIKEFVDSMEG